jgi:hypothetical protein
MPTIDEQDLIHRVTRRAQLTLLATVAGLVVMFVANFRFDRPRQQAPPPAQGAVPGKAAGANTVHPPATAVAAISVDILTWLLIAFTAVMLPLSVILPRRFADNDRRRIAAGTWDRVARQKAMQQKDGQTPDPLLKHPALQSNTGKLAYVCWIQLVIAMGLTLAPTFFAVMVYLATRNPIALGVLVLLACVIVVQFPTPGRVARWIDSQEAALNQKKPSAIKAKSTEESPDLSDGPDGS